MLNLSGGVVTAGKGWTDDGAVYEVHPLKRRAVNATRPVPVPPPFVRTILMHVERFGVAPDGRLFRNEAGNYVDPAAYGMTWAKARKAALTRTEHASGLAKRPYDLGHAGISFWLYSGVDPAECARRAGQSIQVLFRHYAKFLDGVQEQSNGLIEQSMQEWDHVSRGVPPAEGAPNLDRKQTGTAGRSWDRSGRKRELKNNPCFAVRGVSGRRLTGKRPGQAPSCRGLEEAELLR
ncbi:hypothetical protein [Streptomyces uncialis]|uniref:hypothetical protein n=1 Tax=Streptomyces uncialis TaxID=1048205 RepID=UPI0033DC5DDC